MDNPSRNRKRQVWWLLAFTAGCTALLVAVILVLKSPRPLSSEEKQLVGEWAPTPEHDNGIYTFSPTRQFSTSNGQFKGSWHLHEGHLTVRTWTTWRIPDFKSASSIEFAYREFCQSIGNTRTRTVDTKFSDDGQELIVNVPADESNPDGKWVWDRVSDK